MLNVHIKHTKYKNIMNDLFKMKRTPNRKKKAIFLKLIKNKTAKKNAKILNSLPETVKTTYKSYFCKQKAKTEPITFTRKKLKGFQINNPTEFPGWTLYLPTLEYNESFNQLAVQIKAFEQHIVKNTNIYDLCKIYKQRWFYVCAEFLIKDIEFISLWPEFIRELHENPTLVLSCLGLAMHNVITHFAIVCSNNYLKCDQYNLKHFKNIKKIFARPLNKFIFNSISEISHSNYNKLCVVQGRVTSITTVEMKCTGITYQCRKCGCKQVILQASHVTKPLKCLLQCSSRIFNIVCSSPYTQIDCMQMIELYITELEDNIYTSHRIDIEVRQELVDSVCVGSNIEVIGILKVKLLSETHNPKFLKENFRSTFIRAINIKKIEERRNLDIGQHDYFQFFKKIAKAPNCLQLLMRSLSPEMCGVDNAKFAILLSLLGGSGTQLEGESKLDVLIVGDPGMSKLDLLQNAAIFSNSGKLKWGNNDIKIQPAEEKLKSSFNQSKQDFINNEYTSPSYNEHYCIDDIEKLSSNKEYLIHFMQTNCMTERTVSNMLNVAPGASIIASINPTEGHFISSKLFRENVCLSPSLLSLFHLIFVLFDKAGKNRDNILTEHVKVLHSTKCKTILNTSKFIAVPNSTLDFGKSDVFEDYLTEPLNLLPTILLKEYISYARKTINPILAKDVLAEIKNFYLGLRNVKNRKDNFSFTTRQLNGFIALAQARARTELSHVATREHIDNIIELIYKCYTDTHFIERFISSPNKNIVDDISGSQMKQLIRFLDVRSNSLGKVIFSVEELKDIAICAGISSDITKIIEIMNLHGYLLKKGSNLYQINNIILL